MDARRHRRVTDLFLKAVALGPGERQRFLDEECREHPQLRADVESLLENDQVASGVLPLGAALAATSALLEDVASLKTPERIGRYRILSEIGRGGMGVVYLAEQEEPIRRRVALKLIKWGMDTEKVIARFESERQALALMDHANIARVYDADATAEGRPYFVMEHVEGMPITEHCDTHRLGTRKRLELFAQVCSGVQHAHQKGIIHRDIKPSNVLVLLQDGRPVPKIIDFGVAKATAQRQTEHTLFTEMGQLVGTPEFMSPEQADPASLDIDTRTDVYSLGMLLYVLLVGVLPFDFEKLRSRGFGELQRAIREDSPPTPTKRFSGLGNRSGPIAACRAVEPRALLGQVRGDLDWIVSRAIEKERARRYPSPSELAADIDRHLRHEPVIARPPSSWYRTGRFVRRHRFGVAAAVVAVVGLVGFAGTMAVQARRIAKERNRAERVSEYLASLFLAPNPNEAQGKTVTAREILDRASDSIERGLADDPEVQAKLMLTMGTVYNNLGILDRAEHVLSRSVAIGKRVLGEEHPDTLMCEHKLAILYQLQGRYPEAEKLFREALEIEKRTLGPINPATLRSMGHLGTAIGSQGRFAEAEVLQREALNGQRRVLGSDRAETLVTMGNLANMVGAQGRKLEAEALYLEAYERNRSLLGENHPLSLTSLNNLADAEMAKGQLNEAEIHHRQVFEARLRVLGESHPDTVFSMYSLAEVAARRGQKPQALDWLGQAVEHGLRIADEMANAPNLKSLHGDPAFDALVARARQNASR